MTQFQGATINDYGSTDFLIIISIVFFASSLYVKDLLKKRRDTQGD